MNQLYSYFSNFLKINILVEWWGYFNTRTGGGGILCPPHLFFANKLKTAARSATKFGIPAHNSWTTLCATFDFLDQKVRSPGQHRCRNVFEIGGARSQMLKTSPTPKIHFLLGFRPLYFRKHAQIGKKKNVTRKKLVKKLCDRFALTHVIIDALVT